MASSTPTPDQIRQKYLDFFKSKTHLIHSAASLKGDDPTLMFNVAGMQQFKPYFQGKAPIFPGVEGSWPRVVTAQPCMRAGGKDSDIENVGRTRRHHTFFEMLGNFSFGDYFKREAILWAWEFLTGPEWLGLEPERLYATVYNDDDEAYDIWHDEVGLPAERLSRFGEDENFWPANAIKDERSGPCGPCSEIYYDRGESFDPAESGPNLGSGDRFVEIWNLVFTQYNLESGVLTPLPQTNIDTGFGLERNVAIVRGAKDGYDTPLFAPTIRRISELTGVAYNDIHSFHHRVVADHMRSISFAISDGIMPANEGAGYVVKMLLRRASRQLYLLGLQEPGLYKLVDGVVEAMGEAYPRIVTAKDSVASIIKNEEELFLRTLDSGIQRVNKLLAELDGKVLAGEVAFDLWQTYGFPLDLTQEMLEERGFSVDRVGYEAARQQARQRSKTDHSDVGLFGGAADVLSPIFAEHGETTFSGYTDVEADSQVLALIQDNQRLEVAKEGDKVQVILDSTPFYAEGGGQIGDAGKLSWPGGLAVISSTQKSNEGLFVHQAKIMRGRLQEGQQVHASVDPSRKESMKHHSATHLLHDALRRVLGSHVAQAGSLVSPERLRFDFSHPQVIGNEDIERIEGLVNGWIQEDNAVSWTVVSIEEARASGATMLFGEKYGDEVRMVKMGESLELCGGTHVARTGEIGSFLIISEEAVSAGVRRVEALAGRAALQYIQSLRQNSLRAAQKLGSKPDELEARIDKLQQDLKTAQREASQLRDKLAAAQTSGGAKSQVQEAGGFVYSTLLLEGLDAAALRNAADNFLQTSKADIIVVASEGLMVAKASQEAVSRGAHAGNLIREVAKRAGGGGGGRPDMAQAGVKDPSQLAEALAAVADILAA